ncbi:MAG TPA: phage holin family protein [Paracoccus sp. (in: a-proteobacteria)]|uniref:phage holin family protein n=1 Tax=uncultured Paracoccus sp. TaxID=189685 RepID=UPI0026357FB5|nr:phage holin family protein [uncultured Paracoccus sp.]HMQ40265.1 phage holin family protein [Paracoccus sp. (in: a-proteobacteria)]HMR35235.1 phage holin family protein [Paracoccus sp. (in: a-proteobacteria)]
MFDYLDRLQLALGDKARRTGMKSGAGAVAGIGAGFLLAALWSWLTWGLDLGPTVASLIIGVAFLIVALIIWLAASKHSHPMPTGEELRSEIEARLSGMADAAIDKAKSRAEAAVDGARSRVFSIFGSAGDTVKDTEAAMSDIAREGGEALKDARETLDRAVGTKAGPAIGLAGAFALGVVIASTLGRSRGKDDFYYDDWDEDDYY